MATETSQRLQLAQLPGYDTAPDVYETAPDDDTTTTSTSINGARSSSQIPSEASETSEESESDDDNEGFGVSRRRLFNAERARTRFGEQSRYVETRGADLSDRVDGRRKGYRVKKVGPVRDEEERLDARISRLRREVEECKAEAERERAAQGNDVDDEEEDGSLDATEKLCEMLAQVNLPPKERKRAEHGRSRSVFHDAPQGAVPPDTVSEGKEGEGEAQTLSRISAFDSRLAALEQALGISSLDAVTEADMSAMPLLPTLTMLDNQIASLTSATSLSSLESATGRVQKLKSEAQNLAQLQRAATTPSSKASPSGSDDDESTETPTLLSTDDMKKLESLYTLLPTLQSLSPTVPMLITRLRSLRTLHTTAANVAEDLDGIEQRQAAMEKELKMWREGLAKVEQAVEQHGEANGRNGNMVQGWVKDLEGRVQALGR